MGSNSKHKKLDKPQVKTVAIIVVHFGEKSETLRCLQSLEKIRYTDFSVFLIDNGTGKITAEDVKRFSLPITCIVSHKNLGYAGGNNLGIKRALAQNYQYILLLNNDTQVSPGIIEVLLRQQQKENAGITGCIITYAHNRERIWFGGGELNTFFCLTRHTQMDQKLPTQNTGSRRTDFITGACMLVNREVFEAAGLLPEKYFLYWEDVDFCVKARQHGFSCVITNEALVQHSVSSSTGRKGSNMLTPLRAYYYARNPFIFIKENGLPIISGIFGQVFMRLPRNFLLIKTPSGVVSYMQGLLDGLGYLLLNKNQTTRK